MADDIIDDEDIEDKNLDDENVDEDDDKDLEDPLKDVKAESIDKMTEAEAKDLAKKALDTKQKLWKRASDTSDKFKEYKKNNPPKKAPIENKPNKKDQPKADEVLNKRLEALEIVDKKRQFGYENNLSPEETDTIFKMTGNNPTKKDLDNPFFKGGLKALRSEKRVKENTPESGATFSAGGKTWQQMTPDEKKVNFKEYMASKKKN